MGTTLRGTNRGETYAGYSDLEVLVCPSCGVIYAAPERMVAECRRLGARHYVFCPNGHEVHWPGPTEADKLRDKLERERQRAARMAAQRDQAEAEVTTQKRRATRFKNDRDRIQKRAAAAVCPCCKRSFVQLRRHMASKHPDYDPKKAA